MMKELKNGMIEVQRLEDCVLMGVSNGDMAFSLLMTMDEAREVSGWLFSEVCNIIMARPYV